MRIVFLTIAFCLYSFTAQARTCTSARTGNWASFNTWTSAANQPYTCKSGSTPGDGDTAVIANGHTVTVNQNIGTDAGGGITKITIGTAAAGNTAILAFDAAAPRTITFGATGALNIRRGAIANLVGTSTNRLTIKPATGGYWVISDETWGNVDRLVLHYCDLYNMGNLTTRAIRYAPNSANSVFNLQYNRLYYVQNIITAGVMSSYPTVTLDGAQVAPGVYAHNQSIHEGTGGSANGFLEGANWGNWTISWNFFGTGSVPVGVQPIQEALGGATYGPNLIGNNVIHVAAGKGGIVVKSPVTARRNIVIRGGTGTDSGNGIGGTSSAGPSKPSLWQANIVENFKHNYQISSGITNPSGVTVDGNFSLLPGDEDFYFPITSGTVIKNNIATGASQWMMIVYWDSILGQNSTDNLVYNNTFASIRDGANFQCAGFGRGVTGGEAFNSSVYNNIFYRCNSGIMSINSGSTYAITDYNNFYATLDTHNPDTLAGANDVIADPQFTYLTDPGYGGQAPLGVAVYDASHGGAGTIASFIDRMIAGTYTYDDVYQWIFDGFVPTNTALQGTGLGGSDIGAAGVVAPPVLVPPTITTLSPASFTTGTAVTVSIGGSYLSDATLTVSGSNVTIGTPVVTSTTITALVTVGTGATLGDRTFTVTTTGGTATATRPVVSTASPFTYYVDPVIGSDSNTGKVITAPRLTLQSLRSLVLPGDTIYLRGGTYAGTQGWYQQTDMGVNGTESAPITIRNYPGEEPRFYGGGQYEVYITLAKDWHIIDGLVFEYDPLNYIAKSIHVNQAHHNIIRNCKFSGTNAINFNRADYNLAENNFAFNVGGTGTSNEGVGEFVFSFGGQYNTVQNNIIYSIGHAAMQLQDSQDHTRLSAYNIIRNNTIDQSAIAGLGYNGGGGGIYLGVQSHHNEVYGNIIRGVKGMPTITQPKAGLYVSGNDNIVRDNRVESYGATGREDRGIYLASGSSGGANKNAINNQITNNYVGPGYGLALYVREGEGTRADGYNVANNTFTGNTFTTPIEALTSSNFVGTYTSTAKYPIYLGSYQDGAWPTFANGNRFVGTTFLKADGSPENLTDTSVKIGYYYESGGWSVPIATAYTNHPAVFTDTIPDPDTGTRRIREIKRHRRSDISITDMKTALLEAP